MQSIKGTIKAMSKIFIGIVLLIIGSAGDNSAMTSSKTVEIDYSALATEAETNKRNILQFLNQSRIQQEYQHLFKNLLKRLAGDLAENRRSLDRPSEVAAINGTGSTRRIVAGRNTSIAAVPWQVSLREKTYPICGGSVLTDIWILTAAHCLLRARSVDLSVRLGSSWKTHGGEMYDVRECCVHPRYASHTKANDVGLVRLYSPLRFSARVLPIRMVAKETRLEANKAAVISGWGKLREGGSSATFLQSSSINTIAMKCCRRSGLDRKAIDPASMFCAGSFSQPSPDACQGDSGGPIVSEGVLIGVVSWGLGCARGNFPGVYARLAHPAIWDWVHGYITRPSDSGPNI